MWKVGAWILVFPVMLTLTVLRHRSLSSLGKGVIIASVWAVVLMVGIANVWTVPYDAEYSEVVTATTGRYAEAFVEATDGYDGWYDMVGEDIDVDPTVATGPDGAPEPTSETVPTWVTGP